MKVDKVVGYTVSASTAGTRAAGAGGVSASVAGAVSTQTKVS